MNSNENATATAPKVFIIETSYSSVGAELDRDAAFAKINEMNAEAGWSMYSINEVTAGLTCGVDEMEGKNPLHYRMRYQTMEEYAELVKESAVLDELIRERQEKETEAAKPKHEMMNHGASVACPDKSYRWIEYDKIVVGSDGKNRCEYCWKIIN